jgi:hypothetical protein
MKLRSTVVLLLLGATLLLAAAAPAAVRAIPQYSNGWTFALSGLRQIPSSVDTRAFCKGPSGTVYEVALGQTSAYYASMARVRVSDGKVLRSWTYPATPGATGVIPRAAGSDAAGNLYVAADTLTGRQDWVVVKFSRTGKKLWRRAYDSGKGSDTPYGMVVDHHGNVVVVGTSEHADGYDAAVVKWSPAGKRLWKRAVSAKGLDLLGAVAVDSSDNVYAAGDRGESGGNGTAILRSWTSKGRQRWTATATNPAGGMPAWRHLVVRGKSVYVGGQSTGIPSTSAFMAMKYTTAGKRSWSTLRSQPFDHGGWMQDLAVDHAGAAIMVGTAYDLGDAGEDLPAAWKLSSGGSTRWISTWRNNDWPHDGEFGAVGVDGKNRVYAAGGHWITAGTGNLMIIRYTADGVTDALWRSDGQQSGYCAFSDVLVLSDSQVLAAGRVAGNGANAGVYRAGMTPADL